MNGIWRFMRIFDRTFWRYHGITMGKATIDTSMDWLENLQKPWCLLKKGRNDSGNGSGYGGFGGLDWSRNWELYHGLSNWIQGKMVSKTDYIIKYEVHNISNMWYTIYWLRIGGTKWTEAGMCMDSAMLQGCPFWVGSVLPQKPSIAHNGI